MRQVLEEGIREGLLRSIRVEHTAIAILGVMLTFIRRAALGAHLRASDGIAQVMDVMIEGMRAREPRTADLTVAAVAALNSWARGVRKSGG